MNNQKIIYTMTIIILAVRGPKSKFNNGINEI